MSQIVTTQFGRFRRVDLGAGKSVGMSIWRGLNIGLMAGGGYKVWRIVADNAKKLIATPHA